MPDSSAVKKLKTNEEDKTPRFKNNPYQYTRGIRFRLNIQRESKQFQEKYNFKNQKNTAVKTANFNQQNNEAEEGKLDDKIRGKLLDFYNGLNSLIFYSKSKKLSSQTKSSNNLAGSAESGKKSQFRAKLSINKTWLKNWYKDLFYTEIKTDKNTQGKYALKGLTQIHFDFQERLENWKKYTEQIKKAVSSPKDSQVRHSDISESIKALLNRRQWDYWNEFLTELHTKTTEQDSEVKNLKEKLEEIRKELKTAEKHYLSSQSEGVEIAKASFNYYTLNKKPKEYAKRLKETKKNIESPNEKYKVECSLDQIGEINKFILKIKNNPIVELNKSNHLVEFEWFKRYLDKYQLNQDKKNTISLSLDQVHHLIKTFKADQKSIFLELISNQKERDEKIKIRASHSNFISGYTMNSQDNHQKKSKKDEIYKIKSSSLFDSKKEEIKDYSIKYKSFSNFQQIKNSLYLFSFNNENDYNEFIKLTKQLKRESKAEKRTKLAKKRGNIFFRYSRDKDKKFKNYINLCEEYKKIAQEKGRLKAQIKGIEREKQESTQTDFWSLIYCEKDKKQLWLIPRTVSKENELKENQNSNDKIQEKNTSSLTNLRDAKKEIDRLEEASSEKEISLKQETGCLYYIKSLTKRALHKLCFAEESSFVREMPDDLKEHQKTVKEIKTKDKDEAQQKEKLEEKNQKQLEFFKKLLNSDYATKKTLDLKSFDLSQIDKAKDMMSFEKTLEENCYHVKKLIFKDNNEKENFINKFHVTVLDISSYDLERRNKNSANRFHTELWRAFWKNVEKPNENQKVKGFELGKVRLNPEVKIRYRKANENLKKYFKKRKFSDNFKHRLLQDQLSAHFTLSINAGARYDDLAFSDTKNLLKKIEEFNEELNKKMDFKNTWKYGIDRGNIELATLCLAQFKEGDFYSINGVDKFKPKFPEPEKDMKCYTLKNYDLKEQKSGITKWAVKNVSYFIKDEYLNNKNNFKLETLTCLDLTTAKVIKDIIITNGDILTYLKLKKIVAKRRLFELYREHKIKQGDKLEWSNFEDGNTSKKRENGVLNIKTTEGEKTIYWYCKKYENLIINIKKNTKYSQISIKDSLTFYLDQFKNKNNEHTPSISKINHLRDAITANMVGVICYLQKKYPGFIILEDLNKETKDRHFFTHNENISSRLEKALYNKFQTLGLVPPHVKNIIEIREEKKLKQVGSICFAPAENTSKNCPYCEKTAPKNNSDLKFRQHRFICNDESCGFDTYFFKSEEERVKEYEPKVKKELNKEGFKILKDINDPDKVAAYNIAKKITDPEKIGKMQ